MLAQRVAPYAANPVGAAITCGLLVVALLLLPGGCGEADTSDLAPPPPDPRIGTGTPLETVRALVTFFREDTEASRARDPRRSRAAIAQAAWHLAARDEIAAAHGLSSGAAGKLGAATVRKTVEQWSAMLAYYLPTLRDDGLAPAPAGSASRAEVHALVGDGERIRRVRFRVSRVGDRWLVSGIEIAPAGPESTLGTGLDGAAAPTSQGS